MKNGIAPVTIIYHQYESYAELINTEHPSKHILRFLSPESSNSEFSSSLIIADNVIMATAFTWFTEQLKYGFRHCRKENSHHSEWYNLVSSYHAT